MIRYFGSAAVVAALLAAGGCTTVNFGGMGRTAQIDESLLTDQQRDLHAAVENLHAQADSHDVLAEDGAGAARRAVDVLLYGWREAGEMVDAVSPREQALDAYVQHASADGVAGAMISSDIAVFAGLAFEVNNAGAKVLAVRASAPTSSLTELQLVEGAIGVSQRARAFYVDASSQMYDDLSDVERASIDASLSRLEAELDRMSDLADALSAARSAERVEIG